MAATVPIVKGHWKAVPGGYSLDFLRNHGAAYSQLKTERAHMRGQVMTLAWLWSKGFEGRAEFPMVMEDGPAVSPNDLSIDVLRLPKPDEKCPAPPFIYEIATCATYDTETGKFWHNSSSFADSVAQAFRKRQSADAMLVGFRTMIPDQCDLYQESSWMQARGKRQKFPKKHKHAT
jgi:hypothetical protein